MRDQEPTIRSRELGDGLRRAMEEAELNGKQAARELAWSPSWVSRLLSGKRNASELHVAAFLALCRVTGPERDRLLALCQDQHTPGWLQQHSSRLPQQLITLIDHENKAVAISDFQSMMVPGLLQTGDYARAVIQDPRTVPVEEVEDRVAARLARQSLFSRERPARFTFYIHEFVLRLPIGGPAVMSDQLHHLLRISVRPYLALRVLDPRFGYGKPVFERTKVRIKDVMRQFLAGEKPEDIASDYDLTEDEVLAVIRVPTRPLPSGCAQPVSGDAGYRSYRHSQAQ